MLKNPTETYNETRKQVAQRIVNGPLAQFVGYGGISSRDSQKLREIAAGENVDESWTFLSIEFRRADTNVNLDVRCEPVDRFNDRRSHELDQEGNEWNEYKLSCNVGYPSHGSADPATVMARAALIQEVALFAAALQADFGRRNLLRMTRTAAKIAEDKVAADAAALQRTLDKLARERCTGMRVGSERLVGIDPVNGVPAGRHDVTVGFNNGTTKKFVFFSNGVSANMQRVA